MDPLPEAMGCHDERRRTMDLGAWRMGRSVCCILFHIDIKIKFRGHLQLPVCNMSTGIGSTGIGSYTKHTINNTAPE